jgi:hypothetical protein
MIWGGRATVRRTLYMAMLSATRFNPVLAPFYRRLLERGKSKKLAYIACARKLLVILNAMFRDHTTWNPTLDLQHRRSASAARVEGPRSFWASIAKVSEHKDPGSLDSGSLRSG